MNQELLKNLINLRREIHKYPELSGSEQHTKQRIINFIKPYNPNSIIEMQNSQSFACIFTGTGNGPTTLLRADIDALPISESNNFEWCSTNTDVSHKCGHDGHAAIMAGMAAIISQKEYFKGTIILLFQSEEETGKGAIKIIDDANFKDIHPDYCFALHNLPGKPLGSIHCHNSSFSSASVGVKMRMYGKTAHAAEPQNGNSPSLALASILQMLETLVRRVHLDDFALITPVYAKMGEEAFGTSPGFAEVMATLRATKNSDLQKLKQLAKQKAINIGRPYKLSMEFDWVEEFKSTSNHKDSVKIVEKASQVNNFEYIKMETPFRWSEDFGQFLDKYKGAMFGLGVGKNVSQLHNPDYDFPDAAIQYGLKMFNSIIEQIHS